MTKVWVLWDDKEVVSLHRTQAGAEAALRVFLEEYYAPNSLSRHYVAVSEMEVND